MKQILQSLQDGQTVLADVPAPCAGRKQLLIRTTRSLVSAGTERMLVEFGKAGWLAKAQRQPEKVRMVLDKVRTDGIAATYEAVRSKLEQPLALGYCNVGVVTECGDGVTAFAVGDRVVSNGKHAEVVSVPVNLCARIPNTVDDDTAVFTVLSAIGLQGIRLVNPTLGECVVVTGLGLIGLITVQMLRAHGCRVLGIDVDEERLEIARTFGAEVVNAQSAENVLAAAQEFSRGRGVDAVLITAATDSNEVVGQAARMCRKRGRIVLVGVAGLRLSRADFYEKELTFQVSCSYGPGRYDSAYEEGGQDYPVGFVRWTEQRNFEAVLDMMAKGSLDVRKLITHRFPLERAVEAYDLLSSKTRSLGIVLQYSLSSEALIGETADPRTVVLEVSGQKAAGAAKCRVSFLGAGNYAGRVLIPAFSRAGAELETIVSGGGVTAAYYGRKYRFARASTDSNAAVSSADANTVVLATRHHLHAEEIVSALKAGKHVFCEKPMCLTHAELADIHEEATKRTNQLLMVGFNRRFAPHIIRMAGLLKSVSAPKSFLMTVNAGAIAANHWIQDLRVGGGRIIGEGCHFIDLLRHLANAPITSFKAIANRPTDGDRIREDKAMILLEFADGSTGAIHYLANGHKQFPKERLEVFSAGRVLQLDNFRVLRGWGWSGFSSMRLWRQDKGQFACAQAFVNAVELGMPAPIALEEIFEVSRVTIEIDQLLRGAEAPCGR